MVTEKLFRKIALSFPETDEQPHFDKTSFRVAKKIFATLNIKEKRATVKFNEIDQSVFCSFDKTVIYPVPNKWGKHGWTHLNLEKIKEETLTDALTTAYCEVAPQRLSDPIKNQLE